MDRRAQGGTLDLQDVPAWQLLPVQGVPVWWPVSVRSRPGDARRSNHDAVRVDPVPEAVVALGDRSRGVQQDIWHASPAEAGTHERYRSLSVSPVGRGAAVSLISESIVSAGQADPLGAKHSPSARNG